MADTLQNIELQPNTWVDLYATSGIPVGTQITVENLSSTHVKLNAGATQPTIEMANASASGAYTPVTGYDSATNESGDTGAWAYSHSLGLVNVKVF